MNIERIVLKADRWARPIEILYLVYSDKSDGNIDFELPPLPVPSSNTIKIHIKHMRTAMTYIKIMPYDGECVNDIQNGHVFTDPDMPCVTLVSTSTSWYRV
jgi:hypothetical protein